MNLKKKFVIGAASLALVAGMGVAPANAAYLPYPGGQLDTDAQRLAGQNRVETSIAVAVQAVKDQMAASKPAPTTVYLVSADSIVDAATSGMLNSNKVFSGPVVAVPSSTEGQLRLGEQLHIAFDKIAKFSKFVAIGGTASVSDDAVKNVMYTYREKTAKADRIGGANRYETAVAIAKAAFTDTNKPTRLYVTRGDLLVDALAAGTFENGPVLPLNPSGTVDKSVLDYVAANPVFKTSNTVIIGGETGLPDSQVAQLFPGVDEEDLGITLWNQKEKLDAQIAVVQKAAAKYYGQQQWQSSGDGDSDKTNDPNLDPAIDTKAKLDAPKTAEAMTTLLAGKNVFGLDDATTLGTPGTSEDELDIKTTAVANGAKAYVGWVPTLTAVKGVVGVTKLSDLKSMNSTWNADLNAALSADETADGIVTSKTGWAAAGGGGWQAVTGANMLKVYKTMAKEFGIADVQAAWPTYKTVSGKNVLDNAGMFTFGLTDNAKNAGKTKVAGAELTDLKITGVKDPQTVEGMSMPAALATAVTDAQTADRSLKVNNTAITNFSKTGADATLANLAMENAAPVTAAWGATDATNDNVNKVALYQLVQKRYANVKSDFAAAQKELVDALYKYFRIQAAGLEGTTGGSKTTSGMIRLNGENRYETAAMISWHRSTANTKGGIGIGENIKPTMQYIASGNDSYIVDSVFGGQLIKGSILLIPASGELNTMVKSDLAYRYTYDGIKPKSLYALGGKIAVSDDMFIAAGKAMLGK